MGSFGYATALPHRRRFRVDIPADIRRLSAAEPPPMAHMVPHPRPWRNVCSCLRKSVGGPATPYTLTIIDQYC